MSKAIASLEAKIEEVQKQIQQHKTGLATISADIEKFMTGKENLNGNLKILDGALQAYQDTLATLKAEQDAETKAD
jgi:chromosome segregation ATPase